MARPGGHIPPPERGRSTAERSESSRVGVHRKQRPNVTPTRRFAPTSPFQGEVTSRATVPYAILQPLLGEA
jgi:hypothetical protein